MSLNFITLKIYSCCFVWNELMTADRMIQNASFSKLAYHNNKNIYHQHKVHM